MTTAKADGRGVAAGEGKLSVFLFALSLAEIFLPKRPESPQD
jgi:hypothetical protein